MTLVGTAVLGLQGLLGLAELGAGGAKLAGADSQVEVFERLGYPQWFRLTTGGLEVLAGLGLLIGLFLTPTLALAGSLLAAVVLVGALGSHVRAGDAVGELIPAGVLLAIAVVVTWQGLGAVL